jgi:RNA polymerase sigma-70 factor (ECF subfamily)
MTEDVRDLIDAAKAGDREAFGTLYGIYWPTVRGFIGRRVPNPTVADDLAQDVFRRTLASMPQYEHRGINFSAFVVTIARNLVADHYKSAAVRTHCDELPEMAAVDRWTDPEHCATHSAVASTLAAALDRLSVAQRMCVELRFLRGMSMSEIADVVGKNEGAVKALLARATGALRRDPTVEALR